ncbi:type II toxin-antitoxin system RelE/ParE family toxin, partial [Campylobacter jejuni]|nr:type II toxin-antitoxin system RelE/ParE family toxin [Campylobacter jejuni]
NLSFMPYKNRKSLSFDNENIRDLIFKGYVIPYLIDKSKNEILILGIYKNNLWD